MAFPDNDDDFAEEIVDSVEGDAEHGWAIGRGGWMLGVPKESGVRPTVGMTARLYPRNNIGRPVRGLFLDGQCIWYRSEADDAEYRRNQMYGKDAADLLARWDAGQTCWSIEMGGLGPGYEQCIQITAFEILRWLVGEKPGIDALRDKERWPAIREPMEKAVFEVPAVKRLGLSGAQWGAAVSLATGFYTQGPRGVMEDEQLKDRHIQVSKNFP